MKKYPRKMKLSKTMMYLAMKEYNNLPEKLKLTEKLKFKSRVNTFFHGRFRKEPGEQQVTNLEDQDHEPCKETMIGPQ